MKIDHEYIGPSLDTAQAPRCRRIIKNHFLAGQIRYSWVTCGVHWEDHQKET